MSKASKTLAEVWSGPWLFQGPPAESKFLAAAAARHHLRLVHSLVKNEHPYLAP